MNSLATLLVRRGQPEDKPAWARFDVTYEPGESVLDGLRRIRIDTDPTLAFRYSCINANACKECLMLLDGRVVYACMARLEPREMRLEPLPNKTQIRDLVTEIAPPDERLTKYSTEIRGGRSIPTHWRRAATRNRTGSGDCRAMKLYRKVKWTACRSSSDREALRLAILP